MFRTALVTGGLDGIGRALSELLLSSGAKVAVLSLPTETSEASVRALTGKYGKENVFYYPCDLTEGKQFEDAFQNAKENLKEIELMVNCAGLFSTTQWEKMIDINLKGVVRGCRLGLEHLCGGGVIVNVGSALGYHPLAEAAEYCASKAAVIHATRCYGSEYYYEKRKVKVVCLNPTITDTNMAEDVYRACPDLKNQKLPSITPATVAAAVVEVAQNGKNGTVWTVSTRGLRLSPTTVLLDSD